MRQLLASEYSLRLGQSLFDDLLLARLDGKVGLSESNLTLRRVAFLSNQIAGIAAECNICDLSFCP